MGKSDYMNHIKRILEGFEPDVLEDADETENLIEAFYFKKGDVSFFFNHYLDEKGYNDIQVSYSTPEGFKSIEGTYTEVISEIERDLKNRKLI